MSGDIDTSQLRAAFVQAQAQIMNNGTYEPVVVISKPLALSLLDEIERLRTAGDALAEADVDDWPELVAAWNEARRER